MAPAAGAEEIRSAYRALARRLHPDARGGAPAPEMAELNEAWRVLSDPGRRAVYDASLRAPGGSPGTGSSGTRPRPEAEERYPVDRRALDDRPVRIPWGWLALAAVMALIFILTAGALAGDPPPAAPDNVLRPGECVVIDATRAAVEVPCADQHDAVVEQFVTADTACPIDTAEYRDRQGLGKVCVVPAR